MRDVDERDADLVLDPLQLELHLLAQLQVERAERLVEQEHTRAVDERAGERDALLLAAGELPRLAAAESLQPDERQHLVDAARAPAAVDALAPEPKGDVLEDRQMREERVALEDGVHVALVRRQPDDVTVAELDRALVRLLEAADHPQRRRLAAAGRPEQREEGAGRDLERDAVDGDDVVEALDDLLEPDVGLVMRALRSASAKTSVCRSTSASVVAGETSAMLWNGVIRTPRLSA